MELNYRWWVWCFDTSSSGLVHVLVACVLPQKSEGGYIRQTKSPFREHRSWILSTIKLSRQNLRQHTWHQYINKASRWWVKMLYPSTTIKHQSKLIILQQTILGAMTNRFNIYKIHTNLSSLHQPTLGTSFSCEMFLFGVPFLGVPFFGVFRPNLRRRHMLFGVDFPGVLWRGVFFGVPSFDRLLVDPNIFILGVGGPGLW